MHELPKSEGGALPALAANSTSPASADDERARIVVALTRCQWRPNAAALALGISRATLYRRIARLGIVGPHRTEAALRSPV
ncbi:transcriptional regulator of acetoin/glycerol metabolism [Paraburkholderia sp. WSM4175]